jgi:hypothetical protein
MVEHGHSCSVHTYARVIPAADVAGAGVAA